MCIYLLQQATNVMNLRLGRRLHSYSSSTSSTSCIYLL